MKKILLLAIFIFGSLFSKSQTVNYSVIPSAANGTSGAGRGPATNFAFHRSAAVYKAAEILPFLNSGDSISHFGFSVNNPNGNTTGVPGTITIYMVNTSDTIFARSTTWATLLSTPSTMTSVYSGSMTIPGAAGNFAVLLTTKFRYNGGGVYVAYQWQPSAPTTLATIFNCNTNIPLAQWNTQNATGFPAVLTGNSNFRAQIYVGVKPLQRDGRVDVVYSLGKLPQGFATPHFVKARITNNGVDTLTNFPCRLNITGVNTFTDSVIENILPGTFKIVTFSGFTPANLGSNLITVSIPNDDNNSNNSKIYNQLVTTNTYAYADPTIPAAGGVGFTGVTGDFIAKFPYSGSSSAINQVGVNFVGGGVSLQIGIWERNTTTGLPGSLLWSSSTFTSAAGLNTIPVSPAVTISDTFFVGVKQTSTTNANFAFQTEAPIRDKTFYYTSPTGNTVWTDFSATSSNFRFMIEPRLQLVNDVGTSSVDHPCAMFPLGQAFIPKVSIFNYGSANQSAFKVKCRIYNPSGVVVYNDSVNASTILSSMAATITFNQSCNPTVAGSYTLKSWTELSTDASLLNDTAAIQFTVNDISLMGQGQRLELDSIDDYIKITKNTTVKPTNAFTIESWVLLNPTANLLGNKVFYSSDSTDSDTSITLYFSGRQPVINVKTSVSNITLISSNFLKTNIWYHIAATFSGSDLTLYVNGDTAGTITLIGSVQYKDADVYIGKRAGPNSSNSITSFSGGIDEFRLWNIARTQTEIIQNMHRRLPNFSNANLMVYYHMDEAGNLLADASGNCNSGSINNVNATITTYRWAGSVPMDTTTMTLQTITSSGTQNFAPHRVAMNFYNVSGTATYGVYLSKLQSLGNLPSGVTTITDNRTWMIYKYGVGTCDSIGLTFNLNSGNLISVPSLGDLNLFGRPVGFITGAGGLINYILVRNSATSVFTTNPNQTVTFSVYPSDTFRRQFVVGANNNPLPVSWINFEAKLMDKNVLLNWSTASEINNKGFELQRSVDGIVFENIGFIKGSGNINQISNYNFVDQNPFNIQSNPTGILFYKIKQTDFDGNVSFSNAIKISLDENIGNVITQPNPFANEIQIKFNSLAEENITIEMIDINGKIIYSQKTLTRAGNNSIAIETEKVLPGVYFIKLINSKKTQHYKVIKF